MINYWKLKMTVYFFDTRCFGFVTQVVTGSLCIMARITTAKLLTSFLSVTYQLLTDHQEANFRSLTVYYCSPLRCEPIHCRQFVHTSPTYLEHQLTLNPAISQLKQDSPPPSYFSPRSWPISTSNNNLITNLQSNSNKAYVTLHQNKISQYSV